MIDLGRCALQSERTTMAYNFLLVDDSEIVRKVIRKALALTGIEIGQVFDAANGREALSVLGENWVDLVFLDINMPIMNGMQFMEHVRSDDALRDLAVVVVSTEGSAERREALKQMGVKSYLRKPVTPEALTESVGQVLAKR